MIQLFLDLLPFICIGGCLVLINRNVAAISTILDIVKMLDERVSAEDVAELRHMAQRSRETREYKKKTREDVAARMAEKTQGAEK